MRVLYVEDNHSDAELARRALAISAPEVTLEIAPTLAAARDRLERDIYDTVLCDLRLPDGSGLDLLTWIRERGLLVAVVILTGSGDQTLAVTALKEGADDYLVKRDGFLQKLASTLYAASMRFNTERSRKTHKLRVLYAENNTFDIDLTQRYFKEHAPHIHIDAVASGTDALARLPRHAGQFARYDVLLLNHQIPDLDALELTKTLRSERKLDLPIIMVTGHGSEEAAATALRLGVSEFVTKHLDYLPELMLILEKSYHQVARDREHTALVSATKQLNHLLESSPTILYALRVEGDQVTPTSVSDNIDRLLGYSRREALKPGWWSSVVNPLDAERIEGWQTKLFEQGRNLQIYRLRHKNGTNRWVRDEQRLLFNDLGQPIEVVGSLNDITEQHVAEERLRIDDAIFEATRDGVIITDADSRIEAVNRAFCEITGYTSEELIGQNPRILRSDYHNAEFFSSMWHEILEHGHWEGEIWNRRKNNEIYPQWLTIRAVTDGHGATKRYVGVSTDLTLIRQSQTRLDRVTHYDPLTGLPNRLLIHSRLEHAIEHARRHRQQVSVIVIDLDQLKSINDSLGYTAGDAVLSSFSQRLKQRLRSEDTVGRLNGDEYAVLLDDISGHHDVANVAANLLRLLEEPFLLAGGQEVFVRASIGASLFPDDGDTAEAILNGAFTAVHSVKESGGNAYRFYASEMNADALRMVEIEAALRRAQERNELRLHYQPKVDLRNGRIVGAEALLRWQRGDGELIQPHRFIPIAERTGLIEPIGSWVIDEACRQIRAWMDDGIGEVRVAVNVSACQFRSTALEQTIRGALQQHRINPQCLELELTESILLQDPEKTVERLGALKAIGIKLSLDDFGTGYSSLAYLRRFPIDYLKIDQTFVEGLIQDAGAATIAVSIIGLAHRMQLGVIAEGVETEAQLHFLRTNNCDIMQGFYFSQAVPASDFGTMLREARTLALPDADGDTQHTLLVVDDEPAVLTAIERLLNSESYRVLSAGSGAQALELLAGQPVQVILSDQRMPGMSGTQLMGQIKALYPYTVRIVFTGYIDLNAVVDAVNTGALYKILFKPWDGEQLINQLRDAFEYYDAVIKPRSEHGGADA